MSDWREANAALAREARRLEHDQWQAYVIGEAAKAAGQWLETQGGNLARPVASLTAQELQGLVNAAITRWIVLASHRVAQRPQESDQLMSILMG